MNTCDVTVVHMYMYVLIIVLCLLIMSVRDFKSYRIPNTTIILFAGTGTASNSTTWETLGLSLIGAAGGVVLVTTADAVFRKLRRRPGLGFGDAKLVGACGAWLGPVWLAPLLLVGSTTGLAFAGVLRLRGNPITMTSAIPFGPFLSIGFFTCWCLKISGVTWFG